MNIPIQTCPKPPGSENRTQFVPYIHPQLWIRKLYINSDLERRRKWNIDSYNSKLKEEIHPGFIHKSGYQRIKEEEK
jgi:hypothetical protein